MKDKKRMTVGERISLRVYHKKDTANAQYRRGLSRVIDSAIRRAVREAWEAGTDAAYGNAEDFDALKEHIERKYGVKL